MRSSGAGLVLDLFAGLGGWDVGARALGLDPVGVELDADACATRSAAGLRTVQADVVVFPVGHLAGAAGIIASPPCPAFSTAGKQAALPDLPAILAHARRCARGWESAPSDWNHPDSRLVLEPLRWVEAAEPEWVALEQVPPALPVWRAIGHTLREWGYDTWVGILNAADYGVPQTRRRAILMASCRRRARPPAPTHTDPRRGPSLFLAPWVSMAEALGWAGGTFVNGTRRHATVRSLDRPAPTILASADNGDSRFRVNTRGCRRTGGGNEFDPGRPSWALTEKARSLTLDRRNGAIGKGMWHVVADLPATTVTGDPRITARCHHDDGSQGADAKTLAHVRTGDYGGTEPIKLTIRDALILQGFPTDYPVQGGRTSQFRQVGNAVPPPLARAVLASLVAG